MIIIGVFGLILVIEGILVFSQAWGVFWSFLGFGECFGCYNLLINNNIINTSNYVNIFEYYKLIEYNLIINKS